MKMRLNHSLYFYRRVLGKAIVKFFKEDVLTLAAALAFYMIFSLPSMLLIIFWIAARFNKEVVVREAILLEIGDLVGRGGAQQMIATAEEISIQEPTWWASAMGIALLVFTATTVMVTVKISLNRIFEVQPAEVKGFGIGWMLRERCICFCLIIVFSFLLLVSVGLQTMIAEFGNYSVRWLGGISTYMVVFDSFFVELALTTLLFALLFRYLPNTKLQWKDTWLGALVTAILLAAGEYLIGYFLGGRTAANLYQAAGNVLLMMLWIYYASAIFLFGATFTFTRAKLLGDEVIGNLNGWKQKDLVNT
jgi:membrane protein